jgi:CubicO group peptidase (beta-lactamase class C family)
VRIFICFLLLTFSLGAQSQTASTHFFGILNTTEGPRRLYFQNNNPKSRLTIIGFRGYNLPLKNVRSKGDSLWFSRADADSRFKGAFDKAKTTITGEWIEGKSIIPLTFVPVNPDTIKGFNPRTTKNYSYKAPLAMDDEIGVANRTDVKMLPGILDGLVQKVIEKKFGYIHSMLIARNSKLVLEEYFFGYPQEAHFGIQSATKSFVSALTGIALGKGEINSLNMPLCDFLPSYRDLVCNDQNKSITLSHVMSMSTGLEWDEVTHDYGDEQNTSMIAYNSGDEFKYLLTRPRSVKKVFSYNSLNHIMMNHVLRQSTGLDNMVEMKARIFEPLGITTYDLGESKDGIIGDIFLRPRDMLKFGLMYLNEGAWHGKQIVAPEWVKESTTPKMQVRPGLGYAYFWWTKNFKWKNKVVPGYFAWGYGGQYIFVIPELQLVAVFNGTNWSTDPEGKYIELMEKYVLKSCE